MASMLWGMRSIRDGRDRQEDARTGAARKARRARKTVQDLEERIDKLTLICMALWSFLKDQNKLTEETLLERIKEIDLRDGQIDGKVSKDVARCSQCDRVMSPRHTRCIYCGAERLSVTAFDEVL